MTCLDLLHLRGLFQVQSTSVHVFWSCTCPWVETQLLKFATERSSANTCLQPPSSLKYMERFLNAIMNCTFHSPLVANQIRKIVKA